MARPRIPKTFGVNVSGATSVNGDGENGRSTSEPRPSVCVVVPLSDRETLSLMERLSLRHLETFLGSHERCFLCAPEFRGEVLDRPGYRVERFPDHYFGSAQAHNRLLLSREFYERFSGFEFILIYHLDSLAFSDQLGYWCDAGYDYIGAPWIEGPDLPWVRAEGVGNGGFSLRRISSFLRVLESTRKVGRVVHGPRHVSPLLRARRATARLLGRAPAPTSSEPRSVQERIDEFLSRGWNEDGFWGEDAARYDPDFHVAPVEVALRFAFEGNPRRCFERADRTLPFGCHAWEIYDRSFWEPFLLER